jgi:hypothetical protein
MRETFKQWWYWFTMPWTFRHLPRCYRSAITGMACGFDTEEPVPEGKVLRYELWIDHQDMGLACGQLENVNGE